MSYVETHGLYVRMFRADCGSFIKELVEELILRAETFYLRAGSCADRRQMYEKCKEWRHTTVNGQEMDIASFEFTDFLSDWHLRLAVQRAKIDTEPGEQLLPGMELLSHFTITFLPLMIYIPLGRLSADDATRCPCRL